MNIINTAYNSTEDMNNALQELKGKTRVNFCKSISNYYHEMKNKNFQTQKDPFAKNAQGICESYREVLLLMKFLQTKPQVKKMSIENYNLYYTVIKTRKVKDNEEEQNDYNNFNDFITPNDYVGIKPREAVLR